MRNGKAVSRGKNDAGLRNGVSDGDKGLAASGSRSNPSCSDSDDDDVMRQLLSSENRHRAAAARGRVASRRDVNSDGPGSDTDDPGSAMSQDEEPHLARNLPRSVRGAVAELPAMTPVGSPSQTPGPTTSSSEGALQQSDSMDVDSNGDDATKRSSGDKAGRDDKGKSVETRSPDLTPEETTLPPISYVPCHTWPPCAVCARIAGVPIASITGSFRQRPPPFIPPLNNSALLTNRVETSLRPALAPRPANEARPENVPHSPSAARPATDQRPRPTNSSHSPGSPNSYAPATYPMMPLYVAANRPGFRIAPTPGNRSMPPPPTVPTARQASTTPAVASTHPGPYSRAPTQRNAQASSSSVRVEDMEDPSEGSSMRTRGKNKIRVGKSQRAKRYNRKKREEWPPEGWNPIWEEERPRIWGDYELPDDVPTDKVYDHIKRKFDLKSAGICHWKGCIPQDPSSPHYKMLKRHVETVHLGLKLVCQLCGVRKRADNRRKATHKRGCPEREDGPAPTQTKTAGKAKATAMEAQMEQDENVEDEAIEDDSGEGDDIEEDEEEDQLEADQYDDVPEGNPEEEQDQHMESEYESEDD